MAVVLTNGGVVESPVQTEEGHGQEYGQATHQHHLQGGEGTSSICDGHRPDGKSDLMDD